MYRYNAFSFSSLDVTFTGLSLKGYILYLIDNERHVLPIGAGMATLHYIHIAPLLIRVVVHLKSFREFLAIILQGSAVAQW